MSQKLKVKTISNVQVYDAIHASKNPRLVYPWEKKPVIEMAKPKKKFKFNEDAFDFLELEYISHRQSGERTNPEDTIYPPPVPQLLTQGYYSAGDAYVRKLEELRTARPDNLVDMEQSCAGLPQSFLYDHQRT